MIIDFEQLGMSHDWNENDPTKPGYIKNRPFYTGDPVETVLVEESTVSFTEQGGSYVAQFQSTFAPTVGETYKVSWDGTVYECTCADLGDSLLAIGNLSLDGEGSDTGEPFLMIIRNGEGIRIGTLDTSASHTFSISGFVPEVVKIDEKYLPESAFTNAEWSKISNKIVDYKKQSLSLSVSGEQIQMRGGSNYSKNKINDNLKFENGKVYEINGSITFHNPVGNIDSVLNINGHYTCSNGEIVFGSCYDTHYKKDIRVSLYSSDSVFYQGMLCASSALYTPSNTPFTFDINITVTEEAKPLPDICIGKNIQRVGDEVIIASSTAGSTKKFKITVDDSGAITATEIGAAS